jgi:hypothetical protein
LFISFIRIIQLNAKKAIPTVILITRNKETPMNATIETRAGIGSPAEYGGVDWRDLRLQVMGKAGLVAAEIYLVIENEGHEQILNQENTLIELNKTAPHIDRISIQDERDWDWWTYYRDELPPKRFNKMLRTISWVGKVVTTLYPQEDVVEMYEARRLREIGDFFNG